jgi:DNA invertase Pin-like site-specific DNA recombinase
MMWRLYGRWERWLDGVCAEPPPSGGSTVQRGPAVQPPPRGLPAVIAKALEEGRVSGSQRKIAKMFKASKTTVHRAQQLVNRRDRALA